jgi:sigma-B regulation protein RsbU (phosphoserine phosphatase)
MVEPHDPSETKSAPPLDERLLELTALFEISRSLTESLSLRSILENILRIPMGHMLISRGVVLIQKDQPGEYVVEEVKGLPRQFIGKILPMSNPPTRSVLASEVDSSAPWAEFFHEFRLTLLLPLVSSRGVVGIVGFGEKIGGKPYSEREIEFLNSLSNIAATSVSNGLMVEEIQKVNRILDRKVQQLNTIFDISRELNTTLDRLKIGSLLTFAVMGELLVNRCIVYEKTGSTMGILVSKGFKEIMPPSTELCGIGEPLILEDSGRFVSFQESGIAVLVPMRLQDKTRGILAIGPKISGAPFNEADLEFLKTLGNQAMTSLENARLFEEELEKQKLEEELNLARNIQQDLLPKNLPEPSGYEFAAVNISSRQVGGDYFDVIPIREGVYGICIADVSGKGPGAALIMANLQASLHALLSYDLPMGTMVSRINNLIHQSTGLDKFITFFYARLDVDRNTLEYCNAGHNAPLRVSVDGHIAELTVGGIVLGMMPDMDYETAVIDLVAGDCLVLYTDGITEAANKDDDEYGEEKLKEFIRARTSMIAKDLIDGIVGDVRKFCGKSPQRDDITLVVVRSQAKAKPSVVTSRRKR